MEKDQPRYDLLSMPPWSLFFADDITFGHKVKGGRPRMLLVYDCVTAGYRVKHEKSKARLSPGAGCLFLGSCGIIPGTK